MNILVTGGTGFLGRALLKRLLEEKHSVVLLTRHPDAVKDLGGDSIEIEQWDGKTTDPWLHRVEGVDGVVNLAGESIGAKRWTEARKASLVGSRIDATRAIIAAISRAKKKPRVLVNASAVGYYGDVKSGDVTETYPRGSDFLPGLCDQWEKEAGRAEGLGVRVVIFRIGIVLEKDGGALQRLMLPFKLFVGGPLGSGQQWFPWVHRDDVVDAILFALNNLNLSGAYNLATPDPVTMREFSTALGRAMRRPSWAPVPAFVLRAMLGEMSGTVLTGQRVVPRKLQEAGFSFRYPKLDGALAAILRR